MTPSSGTATISGMTAVSKIYMWVVIVVLAISSIVGFFGAKIDLREESVIQFLGWFTFGLTLLHFILSYNMAKPTEKGVVSFLGELREVVDSGFHPLPWPMSLITLTKNAIQKQFPGEPGEVYQGQDDANLPAGMKRPIRVTHVAAKERPAKKGQPQTAQPQDKSKSVRDPFTRRMTTSIFLVVSFWIIDPKTFIQVIGTVDNALKQIEDVMTKTAQEIMSKQTVAYCQTNLKKISAEIKTAVDALVDSWGIDLRDAYLERIITSAEVSKTMRDVADADLKRQKTITDAEADLFKKKRAAEGEAYQTEKVGEAAAKARKAFLDAESDGFKKRADDLGVDAGELIAYETMGKAVEKSRHTIIPGVKGVAELAGLAAGVKEVLAAGNPPAGQAPQPAPPQTP